MSHLNNGKCEACAVIFDRYPGFHGVLRSWFQSLQTELPQVHIACAGRNGADQDQLFKAGRTRAKWGQSSHNWNAAIDTWVQTSDGKYSLPEDFYNAVILPRLPDWVEWYGHEEYKHNPAKYWELPHFEVKNWHALVASKELELVGQIDDPAT